VNGLFRATAVPVARTNDGYPRPLRDISASTLETHTSGGRRFASRRSGSIPPDLLVRMTSAGEEGRGPAPPPSARPPGPKLFGTIGREPAECARCGCHLKRCCSPLEMLGHDQPQPRDSHVRGGPQACAEPTAQLRSPLARYVRQAYLNGIPQHHHRDSPSSRVGCDPCVLSDQHGCGCAKFGTKRPQVQILSPRPVETFFPTLRGIGKEERGGNK
jgi:hypothetical protein